MSTRSWTCMHLKNFKFFSSLRRPETHFRQAQGHQRAGASTGSINVFQSTNITVYEVQHRRTVITKLGKQTVYCQKQSKIFHCYFQEKKTEGTKREKVKLHCIPKAYQSILQNPMAKKYKHF